ncbi:MAG: rhomboid family intramembrane serine protease [Candidatus Krumholzibacteriota bacterium]|nr:rhomboid family intramembrane serine protease [Candidatus Krumholzibacteriota bacterium]
MFLPLKDINPTRRTPFVTIALIAINVLVYLYMRSLGSVGYNSVVASLGATPFEITHWTDLVGLRIGGGMTHQEGPAVIGLTLLTSMFMHGGLLHLASNMLYLWIFGNNVEDILGPTKYILFYLLCGLAAHALHILSDPSSTIPTIGASGAIAGILGAYLVAFPHARVLTLMFLFIFIRLTVVPAYVIIVFWFVIQLFYGIASLGEMQGGGVAWFAHIGGFIGGIVLVYLFAGDTIRWLRRGGWVEY